MITADPNSLLGHYCKIVDEMKPGERVAFSMYELADIGSYKHNGGFFNPADRICGNIVGSAYTVSYEIQWGNDGGKVVFAKHEDTGARRYESPDLRKNRSVA